MKIFLSLLVFVVALTNVESGRKVQMPSEIDIPSMKTWIVETVFKGFTDRLISNMRSKSSQRDVPFTLLPPIDDPATLEPTDIPLDINFDIDGSPIRISGYLNLTEEATVTGLGDLVDDLVIKTPFLQPIAIELNIRLPALLIEGKHSVEIEVDLGTSKVIQGDGDLLVRVDNVLANALAVTKANGAYLGIASVVLDIGFENLLIDGGDSVYIDELLIDWVSISDGIQTWFDSIWNDEVQGIINEVLTCALDHVIGGCTALDLAGGNLDCLNVEIKPECLGLEPFTGSTNAPTSPSAPGSTNAPVTTNGPVTTSAPGSSSNAPVTTSGPVTTNAPVTEDTTVVQPETSQPTRETEAPGDDTTEKPTDKPSGSINVFSSPLFILLSFVVAISKF